MVSSTLLIAVVGIVVAGMVGMTGIVATLLRASITDLGLSLGKRIDTLEGAITDVGARLTRLDSDLGGNH